MQNKTRVLFLKYQSPIQLLSIIFPEYDQKPVSVNFTMFCCRSKENAKPRILLDDPRGNAIYKDYNVSVC